MPSLAADQSAGFDSGNGPLVPALFGSHSLTEPDDDIVWTNGLGLMRGLAFAALLEAGGILILLGGWEFVRMLHRAATF